MIKFLCYLAHKFWWIPWSNFRYKKVERYYRFINAEDRAFSIPQIKSLAERMYGRFNYTPDGADKLWDAVCPPPYAYCQVKVGLKFADDCDGFHSLMYHCLNTEITKPYLMTVYAKGSAHCVLVFYFDFRWFVLDYTTLYEGFVDIKEAIKNYNEEFVKKYKAKSKVRSNLFLQYDYTKGKFKLVKPSKK